MTALGLTSDGAAPLITLRRARFMDLVVLLDNCELVLNAVCEVLDAVLGTEPTTMRIPAEVLHTNAFRDVLRDFCGALHVEGAFADLSWHDARPRRRGRVIRDVHPRQTPPTRCATGRATSWPGADRSTIAG